MQWLSNISVRRPVFASVLMISLCVVGIVGYRSLGVDKFPRVDFPMVLVTTFYPGAAPATMESDVTEKIEGAVNTISGIDTLTSMSSEGVSLVIAQFDLNKNVNVASSEVQQRINAILRDLPAAITKPEVKMADPDASPIIVLSLKVDGSVRSDNQLNRVRELTRVAEKLVKTPVERLLGVGQVTILGGQKRQVKIHLNPIQMAATGISALEVFRAIGVGNVSQPGGRLESGPSNSTIRFEAKVGESRDIEKIVVRQNGDHPIRVSDVGVVDDSAADADTAAVRNGESAIVLAVRKQTGTNTVAVVDAVKSAVATLQSGLPEGYKLEVVRDNSEQIRTSANQVLEHLVLGSGLAALIVLLFLGSLRSTLIAALSIPVSIISTFGLMMVAGFSLNLMTLLALALAVGIVIDDAIVVLENIYRYIDEKGIKPFPAAILATKEIGLAVLATTMSLLAVFLPVAFMSGIVGRFLQSFGLTMAFAIGVSMVVAFTLTPMLASRILAPPLPKGQARRYTLLERAVNWFYNPLERSYGRLVGWTLRHRWVIVVLCIGSCASTMVIGPKVGGGFLPANDEAHFEIYMRTPEGASVESTELLGERIARRTRELPEVVSTLVSVGDGETKPGNIAKIYVRLSDPIDRIRHQDTVMAAVRKEVLINLPPGVVAAAQKVSDFSNGGANAEIGYMISGPDLDRLEEFGQRAMDEIQKLSGVADLDSSLRAPSPETQLIPNLDRAAALGVDPGDIANTLGLMVGGAVASQFEDRGDQYDVLVRAAEKYRNDPSVFGLISVPSRTLGQVPLLDVVKVQGGSGPSLITRMGRSRAVTITCNVAPGGSQQTIQQAIEKIFTDMKMPIGYKYEAFGPSREMAKMMSAFMFAIALSFVFMYLVLAAQFESWLHPFTIMLALPLTLPYALLSLLIFNQQLNIFSMLGLIVLFGMVKKNAILQIDHANQLRAQGMPRDAAIVKACRDRLRPILMTTFAFVAGMLPLVFSHGIGAGFSQAMASIVVGGQLLSLLLTLIAIPVIYSLFDSLSQFIRRIWQRLSPQRVDRGRSEIVDELKMAQLVRDTSHAAEVAETTFG
jgi:hydrophobic/amphiphilic exporter-1 (mainly G- bacteria), HAE1 family